MVWLQEAPSEHALWLEQLWKPRGGCGQPHPQRADPGVEQADVENCEDTGLGKYLESAASKWHFEV